MKIRNTGMLRKAGIFTLFLFSLTCWAEYYMVLVSGQSYRCEKKYEVTQDDLIRFQVINGPELSVPRDKVDWVETALRNGEPIPKDARPRAQLGQEPATLEKILGTGEIPEWLTTAQLLNVVILMFLVGVFLSATFLWLALRFLGDWVSFWRCFLWNTLGVLIQGVLMILIGALMLLVGLLFSIAAQSGAFLLLMAVVAIPLLIYFHFWFMAKMLGISMWSAFLAWIIALVLTIIFEIGLESLLGKFFMEP